MLTHLSPPFLFPLPFISLVGSLRSIPICQKKNQLAFSEHHQALSLLSLKSNNLTIYYHHLSLHPLLLLPALLPLLHPLHHHHHLKLKLVMSLLLRQPFHPYLTIPLAIPIILISLRIIIINMLVSLRSLRSRHQQPLVTLLLVTLVVLPPPQQIMALMQAGSLSLPMILGLDSVLYPP